VEDAKYMGDAKNRLKFVHRIYV